MGEQCANHAGSGQPSMDFVTHRLQIFRNQLRCSVLGETQFWVAVYVSADVDELRGVAAQGLDEEVIHAI